MGNYQTTLNIDPIFELTQPEKCKEEIITYVQEKRFESARNKKL